QPFRSNEYIRKLFKRLRARLESGNNGLSEPIIDFAYGWVCEQEKASQPHYHCWIALPHRLVRWFGTPERGIAGVITEIWIKLTGGEATLVTCLKPLKLIPITTSFIEILLNHLMTRYSGFLTWQKNAGSRKQGR